MPDVEVAGQRELTPRAGPGVGLAGGVQPIDPAPRVPPADLRSEWHGTLVEAIERSAGQSGWQGW